MVGVVPTYYASVKLHVLCPPIMQVLNKFLLYPPMMPVWNILLLCQPIMPVWNILLFSPPIMPVWKYCCCVIVKYIFVVPTYYACLKYIVFVPTYYARAGTTCRPSLPPVCRTRPGSPPPSASPQSGSPIHTRIWLVVHYHRTVQRDSVTGLIFFNKACHIKSRLFQRWFKNQVESFARSYNVTF